MLNNDAALYRIADRHINELLKQSMALRSRYSLMNHDVLLLLFAKELETAARAIVYDCADRHLITWDDYKVIRNTIDFIGTDMSMEERLA